VVVEQDVVELVQVIPLLLVLLKEIQGELVVANLIIELLAAVELVVQVELLLILTILVMVEMVHQIVSLEHP